MQYLKHQYCVCREIIYQRFFILGSGGKEKMRWYKLMLKIKIVGLLCTVLLKMDIYSKKYSFRDTL